MKPVEHFEILVEEPSMEAFLRRLLPKILKGSSFEVYPFPCKDELLKHLPQRLKGYQKWLPNSWRIVVVVDRDSDDCLGLKSKLEEIAWESRLATPSRAEDGPIQVHNRIVVEELEAWYFGDWAAVKAAYPKVKSQIPEQAKYRDPDAIAGGTWEAFEAILKRSGYFSTGLRKIEAARHIAPHIDPSRMKSKSFQVFYEALKV